MMLEMEVSSNCLYIPYLFCLLNTVALGKAGANVLRGQEGVGGPEIQEALAVLHSKREPLTSQRPNPKKEHHHLSQRNVLPNLRYA